MPVQLVFVRGILNIPLFIKAIWPSGDGLLHQVMFTPMRVAI